VVQFSIVKWYSFRLTNTDTLYNILQGIYADGTGMEDTDKVLLHNGSSLPDLIICSSGWRR
jgi:hypothetical protein